MRAWIYALAATGALALAAPASAYTTQGLAVTRAAAVDLNSGDAAAEHAASGLQERVVGVAGGSHAIGLPMSVRQTPAASVDYGALYAADPDAFLAHEKTTVAPEPTAPLPSKASAKAR